MRILLGLLGLGAAAGSLVGFMMFNDGGNLLGLLICIVCGLLALWFFFKAIFRRKTVTESDDLRVRYDPEDGSYRGNRR